VAALAGADLAASAGLADGLREADVLGPGTLLDFAHPVVRSAVYEAIAPGERALAHASAAGLLLADGAGAEQVAPHLIRSEPAGRADVVALLREAASAASGRGAPDTAAICLRRALDEPPDPVIRPAVLLELGLALAERRDPAAPAALQEAVALTAGGPEHVTAALQSARVLGLWGYHASVVAICREALADGSLSPADRDSLTAEQVTNEVVDPVAAPEARDRMRRRADEAMSTAWRIEAALMHTVGAVADRGGLATLARSWPRGQLPSRRTRWRRCMPCSP